MSAATDAILIWGIDFGNFGEDPPYPFNEKGEKDDVLYGEFKDSPLQHVSHCSGDYPMHIIGLKEGYHHASRGNPIELETLPLILRGDASIKEFCEKYKLPYSRPKWILCSMWW